MSGPVAAVAEVDASTAAAEIEAGAFLLDVRQPEEWRAGHAPAAHLLPLGDLGLRCDEIPDAGRVIVVCRSGHRSQLATEWLAAAGYDAANLAGGMQAWAQAGLTVRTADGGPGIVA